MLDYLIFILWLDIYAAAEPYVVARLHHYSIYSWWDVLEWFGIFILCVIGLGVFEFLKELTIYNQEGIFGGNDGDERAFSGKSKAKQKLKPHWHVLSKSKKHWRPKWK